jgi:hypothetical protein
LRRTSSAATDFKYLRHSSAYSHAVSPPSTMISLRLLLAALATACASPSVAAPSAKAPTLPANTLRAASTSGAYGPWRSAPIRGGGYLQQIFFAPSDARRMYVTSDVGGIFRSDDGGQKWRMLHGALPPDAGSYSPRGFLVHPRNANRIWAATGSAWGSVNGVFVSDDGGDSWRQTLKAPFDGNGWYRSAGNVLAMSPRDPNLILAGPLGGGLRRSTDGGQTWKTVGPLDINPVAILFDRADPRRAWACARPWDERKTKLPDGTEVGLRGGLFRSQDGGLTWQKLSEKSPEEIIQDPRDAQVLVGTMGEGPHREVDRRRADLAAVFGWPGALRQRRGAQRRHVLGPRSRPRLPARGRSRRPLL